jgi:hypothetical protein
MRERKGKKERIRGGRKMGKGDKKINLFTCFFIYIYKTG